MDVVTVSREFIKCPHCGIGEDSVGHIQSGQSFGPWFCDACGGSYTGQRGPDGRLQVELYGDRKIATVDVLVLRPQAQPVYFVVEGARYVGGKPPSFGIEESKRFYYEEHSCPTNWLRPIMVYHEQDDDPHGLIEFVRSVDADTLPADEPVGPNDRDRAVVGLIEQAT